MAQNTKILLLTQHTDVGMSKDIARGTKMPLPIWIGNMMRLNIFRNPLDAQVGYLLDSMVHARRMETEAYWTEQFTTRLKQRLINEMCASPSDEPCDICGGIELALMIINDEFGV